MNSEKLFRTPFYEYVMSVNKQIESDVNDLDTDYLLSTSEEEVVDSLSKKYILGETSLDLDNASTTSPKEISRTSWDEFFGEEVEVYAFSVTITIPYGGDKKNLGLCPSEYRVVDIYADITQDSIKHTLEHQKSSGLTLESQVKSLKDNLEFNVKHLNSDIANYNPRIIKSVESAVERRKERLKDYADALANSGLKITPDESYPKTFAIPTKQIVKKVDVKPLEKLGSTTKLDPTLPENIYKGILQIIQDVGKVIERKPSIYKERSETDLRDLLLIYLEPRYDSAGGETFNGKGKTDILIKYENNNVFISELKFWTGASDFSKAIDQLYGYLTWRDTKASIIVFAKNKKDFSKIVGKIKETTEAHSNFVEFVEEKDSTWLQYKMSFKEDLDKAFDLAIQVFNLM